MKPIKELNFGYRDAENYRKKENKQLFQDLFVQTPALDLLCSQQTYFLIGEKGTGKTAFAVYICNSAYNNNIATLRFIRETEYQKFVTLRKSKNLELSDFTNIWRVILLLLLAEQIYEREHKRPFFSAFSRFRNIKKAIDEYYDSAFSPEIIHAIQFIEESKITAELIAKYVKAGGEHKNTIAFTAHRFQTNLLYIQKNLEEALRSLRLDRNHILFIDGIDIRPSSISYKDYISCVKGLANAVWSLNSDFFANIKDSPGRLRVVLLVRPDIFNAFEFQNQNSKISDNSVILDWRTTYTEYRTSPLFFITDRALGSQHQEILESGQAWDYYFPFDSPNVTSYQEFLSSFITMLRYSLYRPRDILTMLAILKENYVKEKNDSSGIFQFADFKKPSFTRKYSDYLLGEIKDHLVFYYSSEEYEMFVKFFQFLHGYTQFTYDQYLIAYKEFVNFIKKNNISQPGYCSSPDGFLQFLYELNVLGYLVDTVDTRNELFFGWCFRERSPSNIAPKIRTHVRYEIHYGLMKALDLGKRFKFPM